MPEQFNKKDLDMIIEVNKKAIEIETTVADQNEEVIALLTICKDKQETMDEKIDKLVDDKLKKIIDKNEDISKDLFKIQVLFVTGLLALVAQIIQIFLRK